ncbi:MAG TPA: FAD-dependent oxidoreductase [Candidatus Izemoplasmatales bacterium]|nr:FAD-dependent oxidoreductase [Bacillota bacterium]HRY77574.1 FAD-dependent oxidoreductase [Candidatus Izemoplasmatales bacterium]
MFFTLETKKTDGWMDHPLYDFIALGGGPAGLNGALYAKRKGLLTAIVAQDLGGQMKNTAFVDNYLGFENIEAEALIRQFVDHVKSLNIPIITSVRVTAITKSTDEFLLTLDNGKVLRTKTLLAALGGSPKKLGIPGEDRLYGKGVSYCATCDAPFFKDKHVAVAGGGNSAVEAALDLAKWASKVSIVHRSRFRADQTLLDKLFQVPNIEIHLETQITEILGQTAVESLRLSDKPTGTERLLKVDGLFVEIGNIPNVSLFKDLVRLNEAGEIIVNGAQETSLEGLYAAGDITNQPFRQIIIAAAEGAKAALWASNYLNKKGK